MGARQESLNNEVGSLSLAALKEKEIIIVNDLISKYSLTTPVLEKDKINVDAREAQITLNTYDSRTVFADGPIITKGLAINVEIPFKGESMLFQTMPSSYSLSGTPVAEIHPDKLILYYETAEKDPEKIKQLWQADIQAIEQNLEWIGRDAMQHNSSLKSSVEAAIARRKQEATDSESLIAKLKEVQMYES